MREVSQESLKEVVKREFPRLHYTANEDEDTRENLAISNFDARMHQNLDLTEAGKQTNFNYSPTIKPKIEVNIGTGESDQRDIQTKAKNEWTSDRSTESLQRLGVVVVSGLAVLAIVAIVVFREIADAFSRFFNELMNR